MASSGPTGLAQLAAAAGVAQSGTITLADAAATFLIAELGSNRHVFIANLELQLASLRCPGSSAVKTNTYGAFIELIQHHVGDEDAARTIFSAVFGFAVLGRYPSDAMCHRFVENLVAQYDGAKLNRPRPKRTGSKDEH
ncbi:MAG: hypothetical protein M3083_15120 [Actinomycetota bacterium]|nr:hypothetical protein [Actinomycetota bacterium]